MTLSFNRVEDNISIIRAQHVNELQQAVEDHDVAITNVTPTNVNQLVSSDGVTPLPIAGPAASGQELRRGFDGRIQWLRGPHVNLADELNPVSGDHSAELRQLWLDNGSGYTYHIPDGMQVKLPLQDYTMGVCPMPQSHMTLVGEGAGSQILVTGYGTAMADNNNAAAIALVWQDAFGAVEDITFENFMVLGDGPGVTQTWTNNQSSAVRFLPFGANTITRFLFRRVIFMNLDGFPMHSDGSLDTRTAVEFCHFENLGNGVNMNGDFFSGVNCTFINSEGYECAGAGLLIAENIMFNMFGVAISAGGNFSQGASIKAVPSDRVVNNHVFGVRGGGSYGSGGGIILAQSTPDSFVGGNYVERTHSTGYQSTHTTTTGPDDGATFDGNAAVNCGETGGATTAFSIGGYYNRLINNRAYNRVPNSNDPYPLGDYFSLYGAIITAPGCIVIGNDFDMSNGGHYPIQLSAGATETRMGVNRLIPGSGFAPVILISGASVVDAQALAEFWRDATAAFNAKLGDKSIWSVPTTAAKNIALFGAAGLAGYRLTCRNRGNGTWPVTVTPKSGDTINGSTSPLTLLSANASVTIVSDGATGWWVEAAFGTIS